MGPAAPTRWHRGLLILLGLVVTVPALAFAWGRIDGRLAFVLYREPKLIAGAVLGWSFLAAFFWIRRAEIDMERLRTALVSPSVAALLAFVGYMALTGLWGTVIQNYFYELNQYVLLLALLVALLIWSRDEPTVRNRTVRRVVSLGLTLSMAVVTAIAGLQLLTPLPFLAPIDPEIGVHHPSVMGYKNPAALAVLGQIFLVGYMVAEPRSRSGRPRRRWPRLAWGAVLLAELAYLASLRSRTSYVALLVAFAFLIVLRILRGVSRRQLLRWTVAAAAVSAVFAAVLVFHAPSRQRALTLVPYLSDPQTYLESDRGTYLRNTVHMARHRPFGVGLGDWQTYYPVYRRYNRDLAFTDAYQVRRAHSDHVQFLGEGGWPGLVLWLMFLAVLIGTTCVRYLRTGRIAALFASAQVVALTMAMATDYVLDLPYNKLQFFLVVYLALVADAGAAEPHEAPAPKARLPATVAAVTVTLVAFVQIGYHAALADKLTKAAVMERLWTRAEEASPSMRLQAARHLVTAGLDFARTPGHTKTFHKHYLLLGYGAHLLKRPSLARAATRRSLELHPYYPNALRWMSVIADAPEAAQWRAAYRHVMAEATQGFVREYPISRP